VVSQMAATLLPRLVVLLGTVVVAEAQLNSLHPVAGDFVLRANISQCQRHSAKNGNNGDANSGKDTLEVVFDAVGGGNYTSYSLQPSTGTIELLRYRHGDRAVLQTTHSNPTSWRPGAGAPSFSAESPLVVELVRRGTFYLLYLGGSHLTSQPVTYVERPSSDVICNNHAHLVDPELEPLRSSAGIKDVSGGVFQLNSFNVTEYRWESAPLPTAPVLSHCPNCGIGCDASANRTEACWAYNRKYRMASAAERRGSACCHNHALLIACVCSTRRNYPRSTAARSQRLSPGGRTAQRQRRAVCCRLGLGWDGRWGQATHRGGDRSISRGALPSLAVPAGRHARHT
jgi:hypothetical protein